MSIELKRRSKAERLLMARTLIDSVAQELNTRYRVCGECSLKHYEDIEERKLANRLQGVDTTLGNVINALSEREKEDTSEPT